MPHKIAVVMDPLELITPYKDTSFAFLLEAQARGLECHVIEPSDLWLHNGEPWALCQSVSLQDNKENWFQTRDEFILPLSDFDIILLRKDPPFDMNYVYLTYLLELAEAQGVKVYNQPASVRDANEKLFCAWFPQCCPDTLVTSHIELIDEFVDEHKRCVIKPLDGMGGRGIFKLDHDDKNRGAIIDTVTEQGQKLVMVQPFLDAIEQGDKRIILVHGEPVPYGLSRIPKAGDFHGNLALGAKGEVTELTERDYWLAQQVAPQLIDMGLWFVGLDVIGDYITEINVTSPTCAREISAQTGINICGQFLDHLME
jgi:glutathione synthase